MGAIGELSPVVGEPEFHCGRCLRSGPNLIAMVVIDQLFLVVHLKMIKHIFVYINIYVQYLAMSKGNMMFMR